MLARRRGAIIDWHAHMSSTSVASPPARVHAEATQASDAIEVASLGYCYGERQALSDVSFSIARGEIFGFLGPNGGGKTTLFKLLSTLVPLQSGSVAMLGHDLRGDTARGAPPARRGLSASEPRRQADRRREPEPSRASLRNHRRAASASASRRCSSSWAGSRAPPIWSKRSPADFKRRVELAKSLLHQPEILLLDEPSTGLDPAARREFANHLAHLRERDGVTIVLTTHHMEEAERCDRIGVLHQGRLVALAPPGELKDRVGGDVVVIRSRSPETLALKVTQRMRLKAAVVDGTIRIERQRGHELVREVVDAFGDEIDSVTFGKPTLEDVFVHLTGHRFSADPSERSE